MEEKKYTYEDFLKIVETLRSEEGCPWDRQQTHMSLRPCMTEEAAEVNGAIRILEQTGSCENLREELGDVLLQVVMHAQIAKEEGLFDMGDVVSEVAAKMVRRHPHGFGNLAVEGPGQVLENWEEIKKKEKEGKVITESVLREIPKELPALTRAQKVLKKADKLYEPQGDFKACAEQILDAAKRLKMCTPVDYDPEISRLTGDILMALSRIAGLCRLSQEQILTDRTEDLIDRLEGAEKKVP